MSALGKIQPWGMQPVPHKALAGKVAVITGAASGIGKAIAIEMGRQGTRVVVNHIGSSDAVNEVLKQIGETDSEAEAIAIRADGQGRDIVTYAKPFDRI